MSELEKNNDISYILNELGEDRDSYFNAIAPPIIQTSNFAFNCEDLAIRIKIIFRLSFVLNLYLLINYF